MYNTRRTVLGLMIAVPAVAAVTSNARGQQAGYQVITEKNLANAADQLVAEVTKTGATSGHSIGETEVKALRANTLEVLKSSLTKRNVLITKE